MQIAQVAPLYESVPPKYYGGTERVVSYLTEERIHYMGELKDGQKDAFLGQAQALLFPIDWPEPFGLVMIEALACSTPVIAYRRGSVPEVLEDGVTGWIMEGLEEAVQAVERVPMLSRPRCRQVFEERFSASRMTRDDLRLYRRVVRAGKGRSAA